MADIVRRGPGAGFGIGGWDPFEVMREVVGWDPFKEPGRRATAPSVPAEFSPAFELKETKDAYVVKADLPGVREEDLDISVAGNRLVVSGKRESEKTDEGETFYAYERTYGSFTRSFTIPEGIDVERIDGELKDGELRLVLPKTAEGQARRISLKGLKEKMGQKIKA